MHRRAINPNRPETNPVPGRRVLPPNPVTPRILSQPTKKEILLRPKKTKAARTKRRVARTQTKVETRAKKAARGNKRNRKGRPRNPAANLATSPQTNPAAKVAKAPPERRPSKVPAATVPSPGPPVKTTNPATVRKTETGNPAVFRKANRPTRNSARRPPTWSSNVSRTSFNAERLTLTS